MTIEAKTRARYSEHEAVMTGQGMELSSSRVPYYEIATLSALRLPEERGMSGVRRVSCPEGLAAESQPALDVQRAGSWVKYLREQKQHDTLQEAGA